MSAHQVTISLNTPSKWNCLTLSFPYPILVNEIRAILHSTDRFICIGIEERMVGAVRSRGRLSFEFQSNEEWKWNICWFFENLWKIMRPVSNRNLAPPHWISIFNRNLTGI
jgi:hypothetical protein